MTDLHANKELVRRAIATTWGDESGGAVDYWAPDCVVHGAPADETFDGDEFVMEPFAGAFGGVQVEVAEQVAEEEWVVTWFVFRARHTGPFHGLPATGREVEMEGVRFDRVGGGRIVEHRALIDLAGLVHQLRE